MSVKVGPYAEKVAREGGWEWRRVTELAEGDVQVFAGRRLIVQVVAPFGRGVVVRYHDGSERQWGAGTEVGVDVELSKLVVDA